MKAKYSFIILFVASAVLSQINLKLLAESDIDLKSEKGACLCYCSDDCGPRKADKPGDRPFIDKEFGLCFCQMRDKDNFLRKGCHLKPKPNNLTCCSSK